MHSFYDVARIVSTKGLDGRVTLDISFDPDALIFGPDGGPLFHFVPPQIDLPHNAKLAELQVTDVGRAIASFGDIESIDVASGLVGCHCLVSADDVDAFMGGLISLDAEADAFKGWALLDESSGRRGVVSGAQNPAGQVLLEVAMDDAPTEDAANLIPLVEDLIVEIDEDAMVITMNLPEGLLDL